MKSSFQLFTRLSRVSMLIIAAFIGIPKPTVPLYIKETLTVGILVCFFAPEIGQYLNRKKPGSYLE